MNKLKNMIFTICIIITNIILLLSAYFIYPFIALKYLIAIICGDAIINMIYIVCCINIYKKTEQTDKLPKHNISAIIVSVIFVLGFTCLLIHMTAIDHIAKTHGSYNTNRSYTELTQSIDSTPVESVLPDNLDGGIIIYYRFGCPDCDAVYSDLSKQLENKNNVYWVSTESEQGKTLLKAYPVNVVPSGIYIYRNKTQDLVYTKKILYNKSADITLNTAAIDRLLELQQEHK